MPLEALEQPLAQTAQCRSIDRERSHRGHRLGATNCTANERTSAASCNALAASSCVAIATARQASNNGPPGLLPRRAA